jgi:secreted Zn-dependent insulinase-like peptidase
MTCILPRKYRQTIEYFLFHNFVRKVESVSVQERRLRYLRRRVRAMRRETAELIAYRIALQKKTAAKRAVNRIKEVSSLF